MFSFPLPRVFFFAMHAALASNCTMFYIIVHVVPLYISLRRYYLFTYVVCIRIITLHYLFLLIQL